MKARPYQEKAVNHAIEMLVERGNSLIVAGTGAGKTIMMALAIKKYFDGFRATHKRNPHVLVLVHRTEIHTQNHNKFSLVCPNIPTSEITALRKSLHGYIHFGMVQTVVNLIPEFEKTKSYFDLIIIDEAHHSAASTYMDIINWNMAGNPNMSLLGVTATPNRGDKLPLVHLFDNFYQITSKYLIESHYLVRPKFLDLTPTFKNKGVTEKGHLAKNCKNDDEGLKIIESLCADFLKYKESGKSIIFAPSHEFCEMIFKCLKKMGRNPAYLGLNLDDTSRKEEIEKFEKGDCDELINVDICTEGYDFPELKNLVDFDTNGTASQWIQKVGRVLRTAPNKTSCTVIDFGGNVDMYPDGVETDVALEGAFKKSGKRKLKEQDFFRDTEEKSTNEVIGQEQTKFTPYHLPKGFESVNDKDYGIVFVACGLNNDCIIVRQEELYTLYAGDKTNLVKAHSGSFDECITEAMNCVGEIQSAERGISNIQIKLLAPDYPTTALDWDGANCCICWKTWKEVIERL